MNSLRKDLRESIVLQENITDLPMLVDRYETELTRVLDIHAPQKQWTITVRPSTAWYNDDIDMEKRKRHKLERGWCKSHLVIDRELYKEQCKVMSPLLRMQRKTIIPMSCRKIRVCNQVLFNTIGWLLHCKTEKHYPTAQTSEVLANRYANFFCYTWSKLWGMICLPDTCTHQPPILFWMPRPAVLNSLSLKAWQMIRWRV